MLFEEALVKTFDALYDPKFTDEQFEKHIDEYTNVGRIDNMMLRDIMNRNFPGQNATVANDRDMQIRSRMARMMQTKMTNMMRENFEAQKARRALGLKMPRDGFERVLAADTLLGLYARNISNEEYTRRHNTLLNGSKADKTALVMEQFHEIKADIEAKGYNHDRLVTMMDPEIYTNFEDIQKLMSWQGSIDKLIDCGQLEFSEEQKQELRNFRDAYSAVGMTYNRAKFIGSPYSGAIQLENAPNVIENDELLENITHDLTDEQTAAFRDMKKHLESFQGFRHGFLVNEMMQQLEGAACDEVMWLDQQGKPLQPSDSLRTGQLQPPEGELEKGRSLTAILPNGTKKTFSMRGSMGNGVSLETATKEPQFSNGEKMPLSEYMDRHIKSSLTDLSAKIEDADPWYIRSSPEFRALKSSLNKVQEKWIALKGVPDPNQYDKLQEQMTELLTNSEAYLKIKEGQQQRNKLEQKRFDAVTEIRLFAKQQLANVRTLRKNLPAAENQQERDAFEVARSEDAIKARQELRAQHNQEIQNFERASDMSGIVHEQKQNKTKSKEEKKRENQLITQRIMKSQEYRSIPCPPSGPKKDNYALQHLRDTAFVSLEPLFTAATLDKVPAQNEDKLKQCMAAVTLFHMVMTERGADFNGTAGPLEKALTDKGEKTMINSIKNLPQFNNIVGELTPQRLNDFIMQDGGRQIGRKIVENIRDQMQAAENPAPEKAVQNEMVNPMSK